MCCICKSFSGIFFPNKELCYYKDVCAVENKGMCAKYLINKCWYDVVEDGLSAIIFAQFFPVSKEAIDQLACLVCSLWVVYVF